MSWRLDCHTLVTVGLSQQDEVGAFDVPGRPHVSLSLRDDESVTFAGRPVEVDDAWLSAANARLLAAALVCAGEQLEQLQVSR
ncbi:hypothetical protein [Pseudonocardia sp. TRM90224]|uniref:hypothetical protein n=1 Tax=Pseudonocardia sp. TRM90224 TaxID=2812678 RepID=UPI001E53214F|nr:hypothetical protein [Pseudonocardia sp. TRM90224]